MADQALVKFDTASGQVALSPEIVKRYLVNGNGAVTDQEVMMFLNLCRYQGLNPFLREVYLIKYGNSPATIVVGKETFTKRAARHPEFDGFRAGVLVVSDAGVEEREGSLVLKTERLVGGWAEVYRKDRSHPFRVTVSLDEYMPLKDGRPQAMWAKMPGSQIRKVALVGALREAFPEEFGSLYSVEEMAADESSLPTAPVQVSGPVHPATVVEATPGNKDNAKDNTGETKATDVQLKKIYAMSRELDLSKETMHGIISYRYGVTSSKELTKEHASDLITFLNLLATGEEVWPPVEDNEITASDSTMDNMESVEI